MGERLGVIRVVPERIVDWWGGVGGGASVLAENYPGAHRTVMEPTSAWRTYSAQQGQSKWWSPARWRGAVADVMLDSSALTAPVQLVWANMIVHAVGDPPRLFARWNDALAVDGFAMFSCLGPDTLKELRALYAARGWPAPAADFIDMHDLGDMLVAAGFADPVMDQELLVIRWKDPVKLIADLRALGGNASPDRFAGLRTRRWRRELEQALESLREPDGTIALTFEVAYGHGFKIAPRVRATGATTTISLDEMRTLVHNGQGHL